MAVRGGRRLAVSGHLGQPFRIGAAIQLVSAEGSCLPQQAGWRASYRSDSVCSANVIAVRAADSFACRSCCNAKSDYANTAASLIAWNWCNATGRAMVILTRIIDSTLSSMTVPPMKSRSMKSSGLASDKAPNASQPYNMEKRKFERPPRVGLRATSGFKMVKKMSTGETSSYEYLQK